jgi:hypothetical protein
MKIIPIKKIFKIIDSCINIEQLNSCKTIVNLYIQRISKQGVVNYEQVNHVLHIRINEKKEELKLAFNFKEKTKAKTRIKELEFEIV